MLGLALALALLSQRELAGHLCAFQGCCRAVKFTVLSRGSRSLKSSLNSGNTLQREIWPGALVSLIR